jgi:hypothetical protein
MEPVMVLVLLLVAWTGLQALRWMGKTLQDTQESRG